jgi:hypothetical protein
MSRHGLPITKQTISMPPTKPPLVKCCDTCRHWRKMLAKWTGEGIPIIGACARRAPIAGANASPVWPMTIGGASCGEWEAGNE